jgi:hypothetical protein
MLAMCKAHALRMTFVLGRYYPNDTGLTQKEQFNRLVLEQGIARQTLGRSLTLALNDSTRGTVSWVRFKLFDELYGF